MICACLPHVHAIRIGHKKYCASHEARLDKRIWLNENPSDHTTHGMISIGSVVCADAATVSINISKA
jgi:hypothetical protein